MLTVMIKVSNKVSNKYVNYLRAFRISFIQNSGTKAFQHSSAVIFFFSSRSAWNY